MFLDFIFDMNGGDFTKNILSICFVACLARSVYLTTLLLGRLSPLSSKPVLVHIILVKTDNRTS